MEAPNQDIRTLLDTIRLNAYCANHAIPVEGDLDKIGAVEVGGDMKLPIMVVCNDRGRGEVHIAYDNQKIVTSHDGAMALALLLEMITRRIAHERLSDPGVIAKLLRSMLDQLEGGEDA